MLHGEILPSSPADDPHESIVIDTDSATFGSFQFTWVGLTAGASVDAVVQIFVSDNNINWVEKTGAVFNITDSDGTQSISLNGVLTEQYVKVGYDPIDVTGGTISMYATVKGIT